MCPQEVVSQKGPTLSMELLLAQHTWYIVRSGWTYPHCGLLFCSRSGQLHFRYIEAFNIHWVQYVWSFSLFVHSFIRFMVDVLCLEILIFCCGFHVFMVFFFLCCAHAIVYRCLVWVWYAVWLMFGCLPLSLHFFCCCCVFSHRCKAPALCALGE